MFMDTSITVIKENHILVSKFLKREVIIDCYIPPTLSSPDETSLLLINDGQDLVKMNFQDIIGSLYQTDNINPIFCVGIHCSADRKNEYGTASVVDYQGLGAKASLHTRFVFEELLPYIRTTYKIHSFKEKSYAGFSLGGLSALDIVCIMQKNFLRWEYSAVRYGGEIKIRLIKILMRSNIELCIA